MSVIQQLRARGASLIVVCNDGDEEVEELLAPDSRCFTIPVPQASDDHFLLRGCWLREGAAGRSGLWL